MADFNWPLFLIASFTFCALPRKDMLCITGNFHRFGKKAALSGIVGLALGCYCYVILSWLLVSLALAASPVVLTMVKLLGALFLIWEGSRVYRMPPAARYLSKSTTMTPVHPSSFFLQGAIGSLQNLRTGIFYLSFFSQFVSPGSSGDGIILMGTLFCLGISGFNLAYCYLSPWLKKRSVNDIDFFLSKVPAMLLLAIGSWMTCEIAWGVMPE
ncbi:LysE family translocator [Lonsdalea populi]|uniref:LysE family translocator n=1 Tax=Lonsdalea populi TaxID=1172565 RepID=UPI001301EAB6|nr:LysE family translocator [Lonsdalea populi]